MFSREFYKNYFRFMKDDMNTLFYFIIASAIHLVPLYILMSKINPNYESWMFGICVVTHILSQAISSLITSLLQIELDEERERQRQRILTTNRN